ncbi:MAG: hypothetical protein KAS94_00850 [Desulfobulbaceae bacterium]|nr:hypothetical protein [Desulfobulbaceae bacterium]
MNAILIHNLNILARIIFYTLWAWIFYFDGLHLSEAMRSFLNCLLLADIVTWLMYQFYLLPRMLVRFGIGTVVNVVVIILLVRDAKSLVPESMDMQAMAIMVFFSVAAVKGFYYLLIEMGYSGSQARAR